MSSKLVNAWWMVVLIFVTLSAGHVLVEHFETHGPTFAWSGGFLTAMWILLTIDEWDDE